MKYILVIAFCLVSLILAINLVECKPQLTFSTNWDGGKRSDNADYNDFDSQLYEEKLRLKRRPGWGKRAVYKADLVKNRLGETRVNPLNSIYQEPRFVKAYDQWLDSYEKN